MYQITLTTLLLLLSFLKSTSSISPYQSTGILSTRFPSHLSSYTSTSSPSNTDCSSTPLCDLLNPQSISFLMKCRNGILAACVRVDDCGFDGIGVDDVVPEFYSDNVNGTDTAKYGGNLISSLKDKTTTPPLSILQTGIPYHNRSPKLPIKQHLQPSQSASFSLTESSIIHTLQSPSSSSSSQSQMSFHKSLNNYLNNNKQYYTDNMINVNEYIDNAVNTHNSGADLILTLSLSDTDVNNDTVALLSTYDGLGGSVISMILDSNNEDKDKSNGVIVGGGGRDSHWGKRVSHLRKLWGLYSSSFTHDDDAETATNVSNPNDTVVSEFNSTELNASMTTVKESLKTILSTVSTLFFKDHSVQRKIISDWIVCNSDGDTDGSDSYSGGDSGVGRSLNKESRRIFGPGFLIDFVMITK